MKEIRKTNIWRDIEVESPAEWHEVGSSFGLQPLQMRLLQDSRKGIAHAAESDDTLVANFVFPKLQGMRLKKTNVVVMLNKHEVVTVHEGVLSSDIDERLSLNQRTGKSPSSILATVADIATEQYTPVLDTIDARLDGLEDLVISQPRNEQLHELFTYKQLLSDLRRVVMPTMSMIDALSDGRYVLVDKLQRPYLRDSYDYAWRAHGMIDAMRDLLAGALDTYLSVVSNRMNEVMKRLTIVATIFMPISFLTGFGGMNFVQMPFSSNETFFVLVMLIILTPAGMLAYFKYRKWL